MTFSSSCVVALFVVASVAAHSSYESPPSFEGQDIWDDLSQEVELLQDEDTEDTTEDSTVDSKEASQLQRNVAGKMHDVLEDALRKHGAHSMTATQIQELLTKATKESAVGMYPNHAIPSIGYYAMSRCTCSSTCFPLPMGGRPLCDTITKLLKGGACTYKFVGGGPLAGTKGKAVITTCAGDRSVTTASTKARVEKGIYLLHKGRRERYDKEKAAKKKAEKAAKKKKEAGEKAKEKEVKAEKGLKESKKKEKHIKQKEKDDKAAGRKERGAKEAEQAKEFAQKEKTAADKVKEAKAKWAKEATVKKDAEKKAAAEAAAAKKESKEKADAETKRLQQVARDQKVQRAAAQKKHKKEQETKEVAKKAVAKAEKASKKDEENKHKALEAAKAAKEKE